MLKKSIVQPIFAHVLAGSGKVQGYPNVDVFPPDFKSLPLFSVEPQFTRNTTLPSTAQAGH